MFLSKGIQNKCIKKMTKKNPSYLPYFHNIYDPKPKNEWQKKIKERNKQKMIRYQNLK